MSLKFQDDIPQSKILVEKKNRKGRPLYKTSTSRSKNIFITIELKLFVNIFFLKTDLHSSISKLFFWSFTGKRLSCSTDLLFQVHHSRKDHFSCCVLVYWRGHSHWWRKKWGGDDEDGEEDDKEEEDYVEENDEKEDDENENENEKRRYKNVKEHQWGTISLPSWREKKNFSI